MTEQSEQTLDVPVPRMTEQTRKQLEEEIRSVRVPMLRDFFLRRVKPPPALSQEDQRKFQQMREQALKHPVFEKSLDW